MITLDDISTAIIAVIRLGEEHSHFYIIAESIWKIKELVFFYFAL